MGQKLYFSYLKYCDVVIGNSSSGIIEVPSFRIPTINIGSRQEGRIKPASVIDTNYSFKLFKKALTQILLGKFKTIKGSEKKHYTMLHRFVFNLKRILKKVGLGGRLGTYAAAAVALLKETYNDSDVYEKEIYRHLKNEWYKFDTISESSVINEPISAGTYTIRNDLYDIEGDIVVSEGTKVNFR